MVEKLALVFAVIVVWYLATLAIESTIVGSKHDPFENFRGRSYNFYRSD